jgi:spore maturation protein SpmA
MLNYIWLGLILAAVVLGGINGRLGEVTEGAFKMAGVAVEIAIGLIGVMAL